MKINRLCAVLASGIVLGLVVVFRLRGWNHHDED